MVLFQNFLVVLLWMSHENSWKVSQKLDGIHGY